MSYYLFARLPHMPPTWTLAVLATSAAGLVLLCDECDRRLHSWRGERG